MVRGDGRAESLWKQEPARIGATNNGVQRTNEGIRRLSASMRVMSRRPTPGPAPHQKPQILYAGSPKCRWYASGSGHRQGTRRPVARRAPDPCPSAADVALLDEAPMAGNPRGSGVLKVCSMPRPSPAPGRTAKGKVELLSSSPGGAVAAIVGDQQGPRVLHGTAAASTPVSRETLWAKSSHSW